MKLIFKKLLHRGDNQEQNRTNDAAPPSDAKSDKRCFKSPPSSVAETTSSVASPVPIAVANRSDYIFQEASDPSGDASEIGKPSPDGDKDGIHRRWFSSRCAELDLGPSLDEYLNMNMVCLAIRRTLLMVSMRRTLLLTPSNETCDAYSFGN